MSILTIEAVQCAQCKTLWAKTSLGYLTISGKIVRRRASRGITHEYAKDLGAEATPTVLCDNSSCLVAFLLPGNDY